MQAYVINLARSTDRRKHIITQLRRTGIPYEIINAVDGRELDANDNKLIDPVVLSAESTEPARGQPDYNENAAYWQRPRLENMCRVGCALSHLSVYRRVLVKGLDHALVLEDDTQLPRDLARLAEAVGEQMTGAEVVLLHFTSAGPCRVTAKAAVKLPSSRLLVDPVDIQQLSSAEAYMITREACERMARVVLPVRVPSDIWSFFCREGAISRIRCVVPMAVDVSAKFRTTMDYYTPGSFQAVLRERAATVPLAQDLLGLRRRRTFRNNGSIGSIQFVDEHLGVPPETGTMNGE